MLSYKIILALYPLVVLACHRLYNRERIFEGVRERLKKVPGINCEACNLFWIALGLAIASPLAGHPWVAPLWLALAAYGPVRAAIWLYDLDLRIVNLMQNRTMPKPTPAGGCKTCGSRKAMKAQHKAAMRLPHRAIFVLDHMTIGADMTSLLQMIQAVAQSPQWFVKVMATSSPATAPILKTVRAWQIPENKLAIAPLPPDTSTEPNKPSRIAQAVTDHTLIMGNGIIVLSGAFQSDGWATAITRLNGLRGFKVLACAGVKAPDGVALTPINPADDIVQTLDTLWPSAVKSKEA